MAKNILEKIKERHGYILSTEVDELVAYDRLIQCVIKSSMARMVCGAQDINHFVEMINAHKDDHVREVFLKR